MYVCVVFAQLSVTSRDERVLYRSLMLWCCFSVRNISSLAAPVSWGPCECVCRSRPSSVRLCTEGQRVCVCVCAFEGVSEALWLAGAPPALLRWGISQDYLFSFPRLLFPVSPSPDSVPILVLLIIHIRLFSFAPFFFHVSSPSLE